MAYDLSVIDRYEIKYRRVLTSIYIDIVDTLDNSVIDTTEFSNADVSGPVPIEVEIFARGRLNTFITGGGVASTGGGVASASGIVPPKPSQIATRFFMTGSPNFHTSLAAFFTGASTVNTIGHTNHFIELEGKYKRVRLILANYSTVNPLVYQGFRVGSATDLSVDRKKDAVFAAGVSIPGVTVPVRTGAKPSLAVTAWADLPAVERTDQATAPVDSFRSDGTLPYVLCVRAAQTLNDGTNMLDFTYMNRIGTAWLNGRGQIWAAQSPAVAALNLTGAFGGGNAVGDQTSSNGYPVIAGVQYECNDTIMTIMYGGDSLTAGNNDSLRGVPYRCGLALSTKNKPIEQANFGMSSNSSTNYSIGAAYAAPFLLPTHYIHELFSPNDTPGGNMSQAAFDGVARTMSANRQLAMSAARAVNAKCLMWDGQPRNATNTTSYYTELTDAMRLKYLADEALVGGFSTIPLNAAMSDGTSPQRLRRVENGFAVTETVDNLHLNAAGEIEKAVRFTPYITAQRDAYFNQ